jgi:hypothetical protein
MKRIHTIALAALAASSLVVLAAHAAENQKNGSLAKQIGKKSEPYGPGAKGTVIFTSSGRTAVVITRADLPKFASNNRTTGTPEENKAAVAGSIAYFGTYDVNAAEKVLTTHVEGSTFPNWLGTDQKRTLEVSGDEMKFINKAPSMGQGVVTATWKRVKEGRTTAAR